MALEMGLARAAAQTMVIPYEGFADLDSQEFEIHKSFSKASPFLLHIDRTGVIGRNDFRYHFRYLLGGEPVPLERTGYYLFRRATNELFHLDANHFALIDAMERFNALPAAARNPQVSWMAFADVKRLSAEVNATLDAWLQSNDVVVPSAMGLDLYEEPDGSLSFVPTADSLDKEEFRTVFQRNQEAHGFYTIQRSATERLRVVLSDRHKAVLQRMKRVQRVNGDRKQQLISDPIQAFDGIAGDVELPLSYSERVIGIGSFQYLPIPKSPSDEGGLSPLWSGNPASHNADGDSAHATRMEGTESKKTLLIETNQDEVHSRYIAQSQQASRSAKEWVFRSPDALSHSCQLQRHQRVGVEWLQRCSQLEGRSGVLLADDMGVGKTLQLLTFLAWCIESGIYPELSKNRPPYRPILITAPLILLETETWEKEMKRFFSEEGNIFLPVLPLYGPGLRAHRRKDLCGTEGDLGRPILGLDRIRQNRVVITNYEALRDYEFSFAYHPDGRSLWSIVVSDEAQEFKTPNSRISHAIKKLQPSFRVACTGTPVENRLLDLWNIFDAVQPGLLGSAQEFVAQYENQGRESRSIEHLKQRLLYESPNAFMLRRSKEEVLELPLKQIHRVNCVMSSEDIEKHKALALGIGEAGLRRQKLEILHRFARLYQHPSLMHSSGDDLSVEELKASSSKLRKLLDILHGIKREEEKAIIFARHKDVQRMLARVLAADFKMPIRILNGETPTVPQSRREGVATRRHILDDFRSRPGFNVIVLSPFVAGVGLTIVEANHVIHYGRWWNPAVEAQATDRAYRLGQTKPVHVYLPILCDETKQVPKTFDELLDELMVRKESLARDTLAKQGFRPLSENEESTGMEIAEALSL